MTVHVYVYENTDTTLWFESLVVCEGGPWKLIREYDKEIPDPVGPGGTTDYNQLNNRPQINSVLLSGNNTSKDLNVTWIQINESTGYMEISDNVKTASLNVNGDGDVEMMLVQPGVYLKTATVPSKQSVDDAISAGVTEAKAYADSKGAFVEQDDWWYKINPNNTFEAYYSKSGVSLTIQENSGNFYRSVLQTLTLPTGITEKYDVTPLHASVNASHNNYPCLGALASVATNQVRYYALSGSSRGASPNYIVTAHVFGTLTEKA